MIPVFKPPKTAYPRPLLVALLIAVLLGAACRSGGQHTDAAGHTDPASETMNTPANSPDAAVMIREQERIAKSTLLDGPECSERYLTAIPNHSGETFYFAVKSYDESLGQTVVTSIKRTPLDRIEPETVCEFDGDTPYILNDAAVIRDQLFLSLAAVREEPLIGYEIRRVNGAETETLARGSVFDYIELPSLSVLSDEVLFISAGQVYCFHCTTGKLEVKKHPEHARYLIEPYSLFSDHRDSFLITVLNNGERFAVVVRKNLESAYPIDETERIAFLLGDLLVIQNIRTRALRMIHLVTGETRTMPFDQTLTSYRTISQNMVYASLPMHFDSRSRQQFCCLVYDPTRSDLLARPFPETEAELLFPAALGSRAVVMTRESAQTPVPLYLFVVSDYSEL